MKYKLEREIWKFYDWTMLIKPESFPHCWETIDRAMWEYNKTNFKSECNRWQQTYSNQKSFDLLRVTHWTWLHSELFKGRVNDVVPLANELETPSSKQFWPVWQIADLPVLVVQKPQITCGRWIVTAQKPWLTKKLLKNGMMEWWNHHGWVYKHLWVPVTGSKPCPKFTFWLYFRWSVLVSYWTKTYLSWMKWVTWYWKVATNRLSSWHAISFNNYQTWKDTQ